MPSNHKSKKKSEITLMENEIEKGLNEKKVQNLVLKKILDKVAPDGQGKPADKVTKDHSNKY